jgi:hypothetical protein
VNPKQPWLLYLLLSLAFVAGACHPRPDISKPGAEMMPVYVVTEAAVPDGQARILTEELGISANVQTEQGALLYTAKDFLSVPTKELGPAPEPDENGQATILQSFDFEVLRQLKAPDEYQALRRFEGALKKAGLPIFGEGPIQAKSSIGHSRLAAVGSKGEPLTNSDGAVLDTHVSFSLSLNGVPLIGPGAKVKAVFDHQLNATLLRVALRGLKRGSEVPVLPIRDAASACENAFRSKEISTPQPLEVRPTLVYYAPPLEIATGRALYPHYLCEGTISIGDRKVPLRKLILPAIVDAPKVDLATDVKGYKVSARAKVTGGTAPYTFLWNVPGDSALQTKDSQVTFDFVAQRSQGRTGGTIGVLVLDANGLKAHASAALATRGAATPGVSAESAGFDVGTEWIGTCQGLGGSAANAGGFVTTFGGAGVPARFNWGNENAWQRDFLDIDFTPTGLDQDFVDNVDFTFYTGHANGDGFTFCSEQTTGFLSYADNPRWGDLDLEWLVVAACGPLQLDSGGRRWWQRWSPAFQGLHLFMGYQTVTFDNELEGTVLASRTLEGWTVRQAWIQAAMETQGASEIWAVMGVIGPDGWSNWNDHVWGRGSVGPDIRGSNIRGYWITWGPS